AAPRVTLRAFRGRATYGPQVSHTSGTRRASERKLLHLFSIRASTWRVQGNPPPLEKRGPGWMARASSWPRLVSHRPLPGRPRAHQVGFLVAHERFLRGVQFQFSLEDPGDGGG